MYTGIGILVFSLLRLLIYGIQAIVESNRNRKARKRAQRRAQMGLR